LFVVRIGQNAEFQRTHPGYQVGNAVRGRSSTSGMIISIPSLPYLRMLISFTPPGLMRFGNRADEFIHNRGLVGFYWF